MLMKGDLVRIPQNTHLTMLGGSSYRSHITQDPQYGIILEINDNKCRVLFDNTEWEIKSKDLQLYGGKNVYKAS